MHELAEVLTDRKGLVWIAVTALFYVLVLVPFNYYHWEIAGVTLRPAEILPVTCGILFGPAAAWGLGIGNLAGDFFGGSWSPMSIFGFLVSILMPYLAYRLWHRMMKGYPVRMDVVAIGCFLTVTLIVTFVCMALLAAAGTVFFGRPFESKFIGYVGNSIFWGMLGGPVLFWLMAGAAFRNNQVYGREWEGRLPVAPP